jgi:fibro-slime domain-containing protein
MNPSRAAVAAIIFAGCLGSLSWSGCGGAGSADSSPDGGSNPAPDSGGGGGPALPICGDGLVQGSEACDDGNALGSDGCSASCTLEIGYDCPDPGKPCLVIAVCGNGRIDAGEQCDDRNLRAQDGCSTTCALEPGWVCTIPGIRCASALCGDGIVAGFEQCDDGNSVLGDGCSATCSLEPGFTCPTAAAPCRTTTCGDGVTEGSEECDDQNRDLGDGCNPLCLREPRCSNGVCAAVCGDGVLQTTEACDDGNLRDDDGCSFMCTVESGFTCSAVQLAEPTTEAVTVVYRDFRGFDLPNGHPDFEHFNGSDRGILAATLGSDGKPVYAGNPTTPTTTGAANFASWYRDTPGVNLSYAEPLVLTRSAANTYVFDNAAFFPLDGRGFVAAGTEQPRNNGHNFNFTSELRYWFQYRGGEVLSFRGDDDVWVFVNGKRAIDLGGVHSAENASITLTPALAQTLGLTLGGTYEVVVFQAERHTTASSYKLTLKGFNAAMSTCDDRCGDAVTSPYEVCDDGRNDGSYGSCTANCLDFGLRCGDAVVQSEHEQCDDGLNLGGYGRCQPMCQLGPRCGDGIVQSPQEDCDSGPVDNDECAACESVIQ